MSFTFEGLSGNLAGSLAEGLGNIEVPQPEIPIPEELPAPPSISVEVPPAPEPLVDELVPETPESLAEMEDIMAAADEQQAAKEDVAAQLNEILNNPTKCGGESSFARTALYNDILEAFEMAAEASGEPAVIAGYLTLAIENFIRKAIVVVEMPLEAKALATTAAPLLNLNSLAAAPAATMGGTPMKQAVETPFAGIDPGRNYANEDEAADVDAATVALLNPKANSQAWWALQGFKPGINFI